MLTRVPLDLLLADPEGAPARLGDYLAADLTVVQLVRYFGACPARTGWSSSTGLSSHSPTDPALSAR